MALQQLEFVMPPYKSWAKCDPIEHYQTQPEMSRISRIYLIYPSRDPNRVLYRFFVLVGGEGVGPKWGLSDPACLLLSQERSGGWITHRMEPSLLQGYNPTICLSDICDFAFHLI